MNDEDFDDFGYEQQESEGIKNLRKQFKEVSKQNAELQKQLEAALTAQRRSTVNETLRSLGANPKIAKYIPSDVEPTEDAIKTWLTEDGELFGYKAPESKDEGKEAAKPTEAPQTVPQGQWNPSAQLPPELIAAFNRVQNPESFGGVPTQGADAQALAQMKSIAEQAKGSFYNFEELHRQLQQ